MGAIHGLIDDRNAEMKKVQQKSEAVNDNDMQPVTFTDEKPAPPRPNDDDEDASIIGKKCNR